MNDMFEDYRSFWLVIREALLSINNEIEIRLGITPTTSQMRRDHKTYLKSLKGDIGS